MASPVTEDVHKAGNAGFAKLNGFGGSEPERAESRASTPKSTRSDRTSKSIFKNGISKPSSRASTPKSTRSDRTSKGGARNGASRASLGGSRQSTPKPQSAPRAQFPKYSRAYPSSDAQSPAKDPPLMTRSASKGNPSTKDQTAFDTPSKDPSSTAQAASDAPLSKDSASKARSISEGNPTSGIPRKDGPTPAARTSPDTHPPKVSSSKAWSSSKGSLNSKARSSNDSSFKGRSTPKASNRRTSKNSAPKTRSKGNSASVAQSSKDESSGSDQASSRVDSAPVDTPLDDAGGRWERSLYTPLIELLDDWTANGPSHRPGDAAFDTGSGDSSHFDTPNYAPGTPNQPTTSNVKSTNNDIKTPQSAPVSVNRRSKRPFRGHRNRRRRTTGASTSNAKPADSPAATGTQGNLSQDTEMADAAPMPNSEDYPVDDGSEIYGPLGFGGNMDGPASPTSNTTGGTRASGRVRKPTAKALESIALGKRTRRGRPPKSAVGRPSKIRRSGETQSAEQHPESRNGRRLFDLAAVAVAPDFTLPADADNILKKLRRNYEAEKEKENQRPTAPESNGHACEKEEYFVVPPGHELYRPANTYGDSQLPQPPMRLRSLEQAEKDRVFGYPPRMGQRNLPREPDAPFMIEDVDSVLARIRAREEARQRGVSADHLVLSSPTEATAQQHDNGGHHAPLKLRIGHHFGNQQATSPATEPPRRRRRRVADMTNEKVDNPEPKRRRQAPAARASLEPTRKRRRRTAGEAAEKEEEAEPKKRRYTDGPVKEDDAAGKVPRLRLVFAKSKKRA